MISKQSEIARLLIACAFLWCYISTGRYAEGLLILHVT